MKKRYLACLSLWAGAALFPAEGFASRIQGEVAALNSSEGTLVIIRTDPETGAAQAEGIKAAVTPETQFAGVGSLLDLRVGDEVYAEVEAGSEQGVWRVHSLTLDKVKIQDVQLPGEAQPAAGEAGF